MTDRPRILLHLCCAPCATACIERLQAEGYEVVPLWYNPNITDPVEHERRLREAQRYAEKLGLELIAPPYTPEAWEALVRGMEEEPEGGRRCEVCFRVRLEAAARAARELGIGRFTTTLTVSPHKSFERVRVAAEAAAAREGAEYVPYDFKKQAGFQRSTELAAEHGLYRQDYCGCEFSKREREQRRRAR